MDAETFNFSILFSIALQRKVKGLVLYDERYYWGPHLPTLPQQYIKETDLRAQNLYFRPTPCRLRIDSIVYDVKRQETKRQGDRLPCTGGSLVLVPAWRVYSWGQMQLPVPVLVSICALQRRPLLMKQYSWDPRPCPASSF